MGDRNEKCKTVLSKDEVLTVIERDLNTKDFDLLDYIIKPASENPMGFLGDHMKIKGNVKVGGKTKEVIYFVKKIPTEVPQHLDYALRTRAFYKEIELYKTLFKDLRKAQDSEIRTKWAPDYYYSRESEILVIEDVSVDGYYMLPERTFMDEEHMKACLRAMAAMHAASIVFEEKFNQGKVGHHSPFFTGKQGKVDIGDIYDHLKYEVEANDEPGHPGCIFYDAGIKSELTIVDLLTGYTAAEKEKIKKELPDRLRRMFRLVEPSKKFKNVFIHGDLWANNLMFRKGKSGKVEHAIIIDFQLARYAPPGHDIMMLLHLCQNQAFRIAKQSEMIKYYHDVFSDELKKNGLDVAKHLPLETLIETCDYYDELGLLSSVLYFQLILTPSDITSKFLASPDLFDKNMLVDRSEMIKECYLTDEVCRTRVTEALNETIKKYILV